MVEDDFFDGFLTGGYLPGMRDLTITDASGANGFEVEGRREDVDSAQQAQLGPVRAGAGQRVYFVPKAQTDFVQPHPRWLLADAYDSTSWVIETVEDDIQARGVILTCKPVPA